MKIYDMLLYLGVWGVNSPSSYNCPPTFTKATKCRLTFSSKLGAYVRQEINSLRLICVYPCQIQCKLLLEMNLKLLQTSVCPSCALDSCVTRMLWRKQLNKKTTSVIWLFSFTVPSGLFPKLMSIHALFSFVLPRLFPETWPFPVGSFLPFVQGTS